MAHFFRLKMSLVYSIQIPYFARVVWILFLIRVRCRESDHTRAEQFLRIAQVPIGNQDPREGPTPLQPVQTVRIQPVGLHRRSEHHLRVPGVYKARFHRCRSSRVIFDRCKGAYRLCQSKAIYCIWLHSFRAGFERCTREGYLTSHGRVQRSHIITCFTCAIVVPLPRSARAPAIGSCNRYVESSIELRAFSTALRAILHLEFVPKEEEVYSN